MRLIQMHAVIFILSSAEATKIKSRISIPEEQEIGSTVAYLSAIFNIDGTTTVNDVHYKLLDGTIPVSSYQAVPYAPWVDINVNTGTLTLNRRIDREKDCVENLILCNIQLQVVLLPQEVFKMAELTLTIEDINDNAPRFPIRETTMNLSENLQVGSEINIDKYLATDADSGNNSVIKYSLSSSRTFSLKQFFDRAGLNHLRLIVRQKLDYTKKRTHTLRLDASDLGKPQLSDSITLHINVLDANDNAPVFESLVYNIRLQESHPIGDRITQVQATDSDHGKLGEVTYWIGSILPSDEKGDQIISINRHTGVLYLRKKLLKSLHDGLRIVVEARDGDEDNPKIGKTVVLVAVEDVNDHAPQISINYIVDAHDGAAYVSESDPINTYLAYIAATDADNEPNGETRIEIQSFTGIWNEHTNTNIYAESDCFVLTNGGLLATSCILDREANDMYKIKIKACNKGSNRNCTAETVKVIVLDENEYPPIFPRPRQRKKLAENSDVGTYVATCLAYDGDSDGAPTALSKDKEGTIGASKNGLISYFLQAIDDKGRLYHTVDEPPFAFDSATGKITLLRPLDYERSKMWKISIIAKDMDDKSPRSETCNVTVRLDDVNDNKPVFTSPADDNQTIYMRIESEDDTIIHFKAVDFDHGMDAEILYKLKSANRVKENNMLKTGIMNQLFAINQTTGELKLVDKSENNIGKYYLITRAYDSGNTSTSRSIGLFVIVTNLSEKDISAIRDQKDTSSSAAFTVALGLGIAAVVLLVLSFVIFAAVFRIRRQSTDRRHEGMQKQKGENKAESLTSRSDVITSHPVQCPASTNTKMMISETCVDASVESPDASCVCDLSRHSPSFTEHSPGHFETPIFVGKPNVHLTSSPSDHDSGRGSSDTKSDVMHEKHCPEDNPSDTIYCPYPLVYSSSVGISNEAERPRRNMCNGQMGPTCSPACREIGHCDTCWMPKGIQVRSVRRHRPECFTDTSSSGSSANRIPTKLNTSLSFSMSSSSRPRSSEFHKTRNDESAYYIHESSKIQPSFHQQSEYNQTSLEKLDSHLEHSSMNTTDNLDDDVFKTPEVPTLGNSVTHKGDYLSLGSSMNSGGSTETTFVDTAGFQSSHANARRTASLTRTAIV